MTHNSILKSSYYTTSTLLCNGFEHSHIKFTLRSWCNSSMASASALVAGSSDEPIRLMVSATQTSNSCRSAWNLCSVYATARASLRRRASCCNDRQLSCSSSSLLRIAAVRSGYFWERRRASPSCSFHTEIKLHQIGKDLKKETHFLQYTKQWCTTV